MKNLSKNQAGIAHLAIILVVAFVSVAGLTGYRVYTTFQKNEYAARQTEQEQDAKLEETLKARQKEEESKEVEIPATVAEEKPVATTPTTKKTEPAPTKTKVIAAKVTITSTNASVGAENVVFGATLDASYTGKCKVLVKRPDGSSGQHFKEYFGPASTCSVSVPKSSLGAGEWKFYMYVYNDEGTIWGESGQNSFSY